MAPIKAWQHNADYLDGKSAEEFAAAEHAHAGDTYTGNAGLLYLDAHYELDKLGSNEEYA